MRAYRSVPFVLAFVVGILAGHSDAASVTTTVITNVITDATQTSVFIYGQNFCTAPAPQVYMFVPPNVAAAQVSPVTSFNASLIVASLPSGAAAGACLFFVNCSGNRPTS